MVVFGQPGNRQVLAAFLAILLIIRTYKKSIVKRLKGLSGKGFREAVKAGLSFIQWGVK